MNSSSFPLYHVSQEKTGLRLDVFLVEVTGENRSQIKKAVSEQCVEINGTVAPKAGVVLREGDTVSYTPFVRTFDTLAVVTDMPKEELHVSVLHETDDYLVIDKPAGILVHPTQAGEPVTIVSWLLEHFPECKGVGESDVRPGIVHRLDKDASGVMVIAKTQKMFLHLKDQCQKRVIEKHYQVLVHGVIDREHGVIDFAIDRGKDGRMVSRPKTDPLQLKNVTSLQPGKDSLTEFWVQQRFVNYSFLDVKIHSGRTHQIRVHMFAYTHPVVGDTLYMNKNVLHQRDKDLSRLFLHAHTLSFTDLSQEKITCTSPLPQMLQTFLDTLS